MTGIALKPLHAGRALASTRTVITLHLVVFDRGDRRAAKVIHRGQLVPWDKEHDPKTCAECSA